MHDAQLSKIAPPDYVRALIVRQRELEARAQKAEWLALDLKMRVGQLETALLALCDRMETVERTRRK